MTVRTLLFDLGNVLQFFSVDRWHAQLAALAGTDPATIERARKESGVFDAFERGELREAQVRQWFEETFRTAVTADAFQVAYSDIFHTNIDMLPVLGSLEEQGYRLVLLSNTSESHVRWIGERTEVLDFFHDHVYSCRVGAMKPDARIFEEALRRIDCAPGECLYTDDIERYVVAARGFGLDATVFTDTESFVRDLAARGVEVPL